MPGQDKGVIPVDSIIPRQVAPPQSLPLLTEHQTVYQIKKGKKEQDKDNKLIVCLSDRLRTVP